MFSGRFLQIKKAQRFDRSYEVSQKCKCYFRQKDSCKKCGKCGRRFSSSGEMLNE